MIHGSVDVVVDVQPAQFLDGINSQVKFGLPVSFRNHFIPTSVAVQIAFPAHEQQTRRVMVIDKDSLKMTLQLNIRITQECPNRIRGLSQPLGVKMIADAHHRYPTVKCHHPVHSVHQWTIKSVNISPPQSQNQRHYRMRYSLNG